MGGSRPPADDFIAAQDLYRVFVAFPELNANDTILHSWVALNSAKAG
jgi:hypothetical protein